MSSYSSIFKKLDLFGYPITFHHDKGTEYKTKLGGFFSIILYAILVAAAFFFGIDIFNKEKPIASSSKVELKEAIINITNFPIMLEFIQLNGQKIFDFEKFVRLGGSYFELYDIPKYYRIYWEVCDLDKHFTEDNKDFVLKSGINVTGFYCVDPYKITLQNQIPFNDLETIYKEIGFKNEHGTPNSTFVSLQLFKCDEARDNVKCDLKNPILNEFFARFYFINNFINLNSYQNPTSKTLYSHAQSLNIGTYKRSYFKFQLFKILTDTGIVSTNLREETVSIFDSFHSDISLANDKFYEMTYEVMNVQDIKFRRYVKVQEVLASVGGIFNFLLLFGKVFISKCSKMNYYFELADMLFFYDPHHLDRKLNKSNRNSTKEEFKSDNILTKNEYYEGKPNDKFQIININLNDFKDNNPVKVRIDTFNNDVITKPSKLNLNLREYIYDSMCVKKSNRSKYYEVNNKAVDNLFETRSFIRLHQSLFYFSDLIFRNEKEKLILFTPFNIDNVNPEEDFNLPGDYDFEELENIRRKYKLYFKKLICD